MVITVGHLFMAIAVVLVAVYVSNEVKYQLKKRGRVVPTYRMIFLRFVKTVGKIKIS